MLFALGAPVAFVALVASFLFAVLWRGFLIRWTARRLGLATRGEPVAPRLREDLDPFGAVAAAIAGPGWGKALPVDELPTYQGRGRNLAVYLAAPLSTILLSQLFFLAYALTYPTESGLLLSFAGPGDLLRDSAGSYGGQVLVSFGAGLLSFGVLSLIPIPPLDGFGILWFLLRKPGPSMQWMRLWFEDKNLGVVLLVALAVFPFSGPILVGIVNVLGLVFVRIWALS